MVILQNNTCLCSSSANQLETKFTCTKHSSFLLRNSNKEETGEKYKNLNILQKKLLTKILFDICEDCSKNMAAIPQGAFAACKLRENFREREMLISRMKKDNGKGNNSNEKNDTKYPIPNKKMLEYSPVKYNGKLMNSIWGLYNRYSPHNIKSNDDLEQNYFLQQPIAVAGFSIAENIAMVMDSAKEWGFTDK